ncbi:MAG TPA: DUF4149 domain-containing protein [Noviherbaspirillum sp.]|jgi:hypothetical protein|uniref:DUF4149 domain-containing protein n=1 Tax=Noviherbaspirillum sp. TaxID=1926288 RepID=UPI002F939538
MLASRVVLLVVTAWVGSLWTVGYLVAPTLFATLADRALAGTIAGRLFRVEAWLTLACGLVLLGMFLLSGAVEEVRRRRQLVAIVVAMLACTAIGFFALQPFMADLRASAGPGRVMDADARARFGLLHGVASALYLIQSLLGVVLLLRVRLR